MSDDCREVAFLIASFLLAVYLCMMLATDPSAKVKRPQTVFDQVNERVSDISH